MGASILRRFPWQMPRRRIAGSALRSVVSMYCTFASCCCTARQTVSAGLESFTAAPLTADESARSETGCARRTGAPSCARPARVDQLADRASTAPILRCDNSIRL